MNLNAGRSQIPNRICLREVNKKKKKGRGNRGSEEDPLLSPVDPWKGGIDNPAITSDPEQDDKKTKKKKAPKIKEPKKVSWYFFFHFNFLRMDSIII